MTAVSAPGTSATGGEIAPGAQLGDYRVEGVIARGGMGIVLSAVHPLIGKRAAIKVLKADLCSDPLTVERFVAEARVVNQIGNPNIVDVFAFGTTPDGRSYLAMEWLQGESLRQRLARGRMTVAEACEVIRPIARALIAAHDQGVIHRDLKPDNIFLVEVKGERPRVKLLDFGIAKLVHHDQPRLEQTASGVLVGTPMYAAPEQAKGTAVDARVDIYGLGGVLFEMLAGRPPFVADTSMEVMAKHLMEAPQRPSTFAPVPAELDALVLAMLAKEPARRPTLVHVLATVDRVEDSVPRVTSPVQFERDSYGSIAVTQRRGATPDDPPRPRRAWLVLAPAIVLAGGVAAWLAVRAMNGDEAAATPVQPASAITPIGGADASVDRASTLPVASMPIDAAPAAVPASDAAIAPPHVAAPTTEHHRERQRKPIHDGSAAPIVPAPEPTRPPIDPASTGDSELLPHGSVNGGGK